MKARNKLKNGEHQHDFPGNVAAWRSRWSLLLFLLLASSWPLSACLWITGTTKDGRHTTTGGFGPARQLRHRMQANLRARGDSIQAELRNSSDFTNRNDFAVSLIYQGRYEQAIAVLEQSEKDHPGEYFTAANLGTAYELAGRDEDAMGWITEGIRRNKESHEGTEWLHVKILEAKIKAATDSSYFQHHSVLDLDFTQIARDDDSLSVGGQLRALTEVQKALQYQLEERLQFVKAKDAPVASLLFDYAAITAATQTLEAAKELLQLAVEYGYPQERVLSLVARYDRIILIAQIRRRVLISSFIALGACCIVYAVKRRWIVCRRNAD
jgi:hypothetical protein